MAPEKYIKRSRQRILCPSTIIVCTSRSWFFKYNVSKGHDCKIRKNKRTAAEKYFFGSKYSRHMKNIYMEPVNALSPKSYFITCEHSERCDMSKTIIVPWNRRTRDICFWIQDCFLSFFKGHIHHKNTSLLFKLLFFFFT